MDSSIKFTFRSALHSPSRSSCVVNISKFTHLCQFISWHPITYDTIVVCNVWLNYSMLVHYLVINMTQESDCLFVWLWSVRKESVWSRWSIGHKDKTGTSPSQLYIQGCILVKLKWNRRSLSFIRGQKGQVDTNYSKATCVSFRNTEHFFRRITLWYCSRHFTDFNQRNIQI